MSTWKATFGKEKEGELSGRELLLSKLGGKIKGLTGAEQKYITAIVIEESKASPGVPVLGKVPVGKIKEMGPSECICPVCPIETTQKKSGTQYPAMTSVTMAGNFKSVIKQAYEVGYISLILMIVGIGLSLYGLIKYLSVDYFSNDVIPYILQNVVVLVLITIGIEMHRTINRDLKFGGLNWKPLAVGGGAFIVSVFVQTLIKITVKVAVSEIDLYLLYISLAISEEYCFRLGLLSAFEAIIRERYDNQWVGAGLGIGLSSALFMVYHIFVYNTLESLLSVLAMGLIFGIAYRGVKNLDASIIPHIVTNFIAGTIIFATSIASLVL